VKGVIPSWAGAKLSFRLVHDQDPSEIEALFRRHVSRLTPQTVSSKVRRLAMAKPALVDPDHPAVRAAFNALQRSFGTAPVFLRSGGTIPVVNTFQEILGVPTVLMGFGLPDDRAHAPNEKFHLPNFFKGIETSLWFLHGMTRLARRSPCKFRDNHTRAHYAGVADVSSIGAQNE
jgi:acetylornithine deacetylase/succinyl-diaminopimelate desuccinylase-like protein